MERILKKFFDFAPLGSGKLDIEPSGFNELVHYLVNRIGKEVPTEIMVTNVQVNDLCKKGLICIREAFDLWTVQDLELRVEKLKVGLMLLIIVELVKDVWGVRQLCLTLESFLYVDPDTRMLLGYITREEAGEIGDSLNFCLNVLKYPFHGKGLVSPPRFTQTQGTLLIPSGFSGMQEEYPFGIVARLNASARRQRDEDEGKRIKFDQLNVEPLIFKADAVLLSDMRKGKISVSPFVSKILNEYLMLRFNCVRMKILNAFRDWEEATTVGAFTSSWARSTYSKVISSFQMEENINIIKKAISENETVAEVGGEVEEAEGAGSFGSERHKQVLNGISKITGFYFNECMQIFHMFGCL